MAHNASRNRDAVREERDFAVYPHQTLPHRACRNRFSKFSFQTTLLSLVLYDKILWYE